MAKVLGVVVGFLTLVTGCSSGDADPFGSHALYAAGATHALCLSSDRGATMTEGIDTIVNHGPGPVHIERAAWLNNQGLKLLEIGIFQHLQGDQFATFGEWRGYPPRGLAQGGATLVAAWNRMVPAAGATLPLTNGQRDYFDIVVSWSGRAGRAGPVRLVYTDAEGQKGIVDTLVTVRVRPTC